MSICKLISEEIEAIQRDELDIDNLDPNKYDDYIKALSANIELLKILEDILNGDSVAIEKLDKLISLGVINIKNLSSKNITSKIENINQDTVIFLGNISFRIYYKYFQKTTLPIKLKFIIGNLICENEDIPKIEMEYIQFLKVHSCPTVDKIHIRHIGSLSCHDCYKLSSLKLQIVDRLCEINYCPELNINCINSFDADKKIALGRLPINTQYTLSELQSKFHFEMLQDDAIFFS